ncbi:hypothetical protein ALC53_10527 [Atta colombica]|uniref:Reverse transcriptase domain-containing protein n=1 Tax=Atta colombica TaxID=520822 RepID=A0A195B3A3_9HYME|nr:hypothetical protein ALC53_10527 [Atta colombica]
MGRIRDKRKMKEKKGGGETKEDGAVRKHEVCDKHMRKEEGKSKECEDITREEVYRDLWRVSISSEYRKVVGQLSGRYGDRDKCSLKGPTKERSGDTSSTNRCLIRYFSISGLISRQYQPSLMIRTSCYSAQTPRREMTINVIADESNNNSYEWQMDRLKEMCRLSCCCRSCVADASASSPMYSRTFLSLATYAPPKVHKVNCSFRIIISSLNSTLYSLDVISLFINIPTDLALDVLSNRYKQTFGTPMGLPLSSILANLVMDLMIPTFSGRILNFLSQLISQKEGHNLQFGSKKRVKWFSIPYVEEILFSLIFSNKFKNIINGVSFFSLNKLNQFIKIKDSLNDDLKRNVVYKINCCDCDASYVG